MYGGQARIPGRHAVLSVDFEMIQERQDVFSAHLLDLQIDYGTEMVGGEKPQQQDKRVAVTQQGSRTEPPGEGQVLGKERTECRGEGGGDGSLH
jgi:hypothetical protein